MRKLFDIEWVKAYHYSSFRIFILLHFVLFVIILFLGSRIDISVPGFSVHKVYQFPHVWSSFSWLAGSGFFNLLLAIPVIVLTGNEYTFRTNCQQLFAGLSRKELFSGKLILIGLLTAYGFLLVVFSSLISGLLFSTELSFSLIFDNSWIALMYLLKAFSVMLFAYLVSVTFRNNALSIVMFLLYFIMIEPVLRRFFPADMRLYFPARVIGHLTPVPEFLSIASHKTMIGSTGQDQLSFESIGLVGKNLSAGLTVLFSLIYAIIFSFLTWWQIKKKDL